MRNTRLPKQLARDVLKALRVEEPPVDLRAVIEYLSESRSITIELLPYSLPDKVSGAHARKGRKHIITYNKNHHPRRQRFTIAHELGHLLLEHLDVQSKEEDLVSGNPKETAANTFAAELLAPSEFLKKDFEKGVRDVKALAARYQVSEEMMWWRIMDARMYRKIKRKML